MIFTKRKYMSSNGKQLLEHPSRAPKQFSMKYAQLDTKHISKTTLTHSHYKKINGRHFPLKFFTFTPRRPGSYTTSSLGQGSSRTAPKSHNHTYDSKTIKHIQLGHNTLQSMPVRNLKVNRKKTSKLNPKSKIYPHKLKFFAINRN